MRNGDHLAFVRALLENGPLPESEVVVRFGQIFSAPYALRYWQGRTFRQRRAYNALVDVEASEIIPANERAAIRSARRELAQNRLGDYRRRGHIKRTLYSNGRVYLQLRETP